jgi:outer membrane cobalamin receptor
MRCHGWNIGPIAIVCALVFSAPLLRARDSEGDPSVFDLSFDELMEVRIASVTSASRLRESEVDAPGTMVVISREQIERRGYTTLVDVLRDLPGMDVTPYYFSEIGARVGVRGISGNNKIVVLVNGMRINPPGGEYYPFRSDLSVVAAKQVEVVYGPGSTLHGQDAISAVINIVTEAPVADVGIMSLAAGTDHAREAWMSFGGRIGSEQKGRIYGYIHYTDSDLTRLDRDYPDWWEPYEERALARGSGTPPERQDLGVNAFLRLEMNGSSLQLFHRESRRSSSEGFSPILGYVKEAVWHDRSTVLQGENQVPLSDTSSLESSLTFNRYEIDPSSRYVFAANETRWFLNDYKYGRGVSLALEEVVRISLCDDMRLLIGVLAGTHEITPKATVPGGATTTEDLGSQAGSFVYFTEPGNPETRQEIPRAMTVGYETYAAYVESAWQANARLKAIVGLRWTWDTRLDEVPFTPRGALVWSITDQLTAKYVATKAYVAPAPYFAHAPFDNGTRLATANPDIDPEEAMSHEVSLRLVRKDMQLGVSAYHGEQENLLVIADAPVKQNIVRDTVYLEDGTTRTLAQTVNGCESRNTGIDLYGEFKAGCLTPWLSISYVDYEECTHESKSGLRGLSDTNGRLGATWAATRKLLVTPSLVVRSKPDNVRKGVLDSELQWPWELNLYVLYRMTEDANLFARLYNVTDHTYALGGFAGEPVPQETFHGLVGAKIRF